MVRIARKGGAGRGLIYWDCHETSAAQNKRTAAAAPLPPAFGAKLYIAGAGLRQRRGNTMAILVGQLRLGHCLGGRGRFDFPVFLKYGN